jgi:hypothetical protein
MVADNEGAYGENFWLCGDPALKEATVAVSGASSSASARVRLPCLLHPNHLPPPLATPRRYRS